MDTLHRIKRFFMLTCFKLCEFIKITLLYIFTYFIEKNLAYHLRILFNQRASKMSSYFEEKSCFKKTKEMYNNGQK